MTQKNKLICSIGASTTSFTKYNILNTTSKYLTPDYFLPASQSESYYSRKYGRSISRISRIVSASLLSAMMLTATLDAKAQPTIVPNQSFLFGNSSAGISTNVPVPPPAPPTPPSPPVLPAMPDFIGDVVIGGKSDNRSALFESIRNFGKNILKKVKKEPKPKVISSDSGDLMSQLYDTLERRRSGISGEKKSAKPKKVVKQAPKLTSEEITRKKAENLARAATIREQNKKKWDEAAKKNEEIARERRRAEAEAVKARIEQKARERGEHREGVVNGIDPALHHNIVTELRSEIALLREQLKNQNSNNLAGTIGGRTEEPIYSKPIDTISMASSSTEYSKPWQDPDTLIGEAFETEFSTSKVQKQIAPSAPPLSVFSSTEELHISEADSLGEEEQVIKMLERGIEDSGYGGSSCGGADDWSGEDSISDTDGYDTVYTSSGSRHSEDSDDEEGIPFLPPTTEAEKAELDGIRELQVSRQSSAVASNDSINEVSIALDSNESEEVSQEESTAASVLEIQDEVDGEDGLPKDMSANLRNTASTEPQEQATSMSQEELRKKATMVAASHNQAREARKISSNHIKHRIFARAVLTAAVAAGDEEAGEALDDAVEQTRGYSIWSSGTLGSNKQKSKADLNGYSTKIAGGTIGLELNLENDLLVGSSFSRFNSRVKYQDQGEASDLRSSTASNRAKYATYIFSLYGSSPVSRDISMSVIGSAGLSKGKKARSTLFSLEPHLNYKLKLPREVTLIPHIGLRYEYEKANAYQEQIASNLSIERSKKSYQALSGEIGSRVIFAPIKLNGSTPRAISITPTAHFSVERRIGSRGKSHPFTLTYYESQQTIGTGTISTNAQNERTGLNAGVGLIASRKNIRLELLYDQQRQKRFKSHQGVLKLKIGL